MSKRVGRIFDAVWRDDVHSIAKLLDQDPLLAQVRHVNGASLLHCSRSPAMTTLLLETEAPVHAVRAYGWTALHSAVYAREQEVARVLLQWGADANAQTEDGDTALHFAVENGDESMVRLLLGNGAKVETADRTGFMPIYEAVMDGHYGILEHLLATAADPNARAGPDGRTALHAAAYLNDPRSIHILAKYGARPDLMDACGNTPADCATTPEVRALLREVSGLDT